MKKLNKTIPLLLLSIPFVASGCSNNKEEEKPVEPEIIVPWNDESSIKLEQMSATISLGETFQIRVTSGGGVTYTSNNPEVATVSSNGLLTSVSEGDAAIKISSGNDFVYFRLHVGAGSQEIIVGDPYISLSNGDLSLYIGENYSLKPKLMIDNTVLSNATFVYTVENNDVLEINDGKIITKSSGSTLVTVKGQKENAVATKSFTVSVLENLIYLVPDFETREVVAGSPLKLNFALINNSKMITSGVSNFTYSVDDTNLAYISGDELFSIRKGNIVLSASADYSGTTYTCNVNIATKELYKVTYSVDGKLLHEEYIISGKCITYKEIPSKKDCVFKCWTDGVSSVDNTTPINSEMNLTPKWLGYSSNINSEDKVLLWDYSVGNEIACGSNCGTYLWEDYQYPDSHINVQVHSSSGTAPRRDENILIKLPKFEFGVFPAVSFYFYTQVYDVKFVYRSFVSPIIAYKSKSQVSIVGNKLYFNGVDTGESITNEVLNAAEELSFEFNTKITNSGKICFTGFYCHLDEII